MLFRSTELTHDSIAIYSQKISQLLIDNFKLEGLTVHTFLTIKGLKEIDTSFINDYLFTTTGRVATSITHYKPLALSHTLVTKETEFTVDQFNIPTPKTIRLIDAKEMDIVLVPLLAFDIKGNRIGYGKGLYDSFLKDCSPTCIKIGLSFFEANDELIPSEKHDIRLDYCITPTKTYSFN